jgi:transcriptional regulator with XRE-family HTH domain
MPAPHLGRGMAKGLHDERYRRLIDRLVARRKELGLTQQAVADGVGMHQQNVSRFETGERRLDVVELVDVASVLGLDAAELVRSVPAKKANS